MILFRSLHNSSLFVVSCFCFLFFRGWGGGRYSYLLHFLDEVELHQYCIRCTAYLLRLGSYKICEQFMHPLNIKIPLNVTRPILPDCVHYFSQICEGTCDTLKIWQEFSIKFQQIFRRLYPMF